MTLPKRCLRKINCSGVKYMPFFNWPAVGNDSPWQVYYYLARATPASFFSSSFFFIFLLLYLLILFIFILTGLNRCILGFLRKFEFMCTNHRHADRYEPESLNCYDWYLYLYLYLCLYALTWIGGLNYSRKLIYCKQLTTHLDCPFYCTYITCYFPAIPHVWLFPQCWYNEQDNFNFQFIFFFIK